MRLILWKMAHSDSERVWAPQWTESTQNAMNRLITVQLMNDILYNYKGSVVDHRERLISITNKCIKYKSRHCTLPLVLGGFKVNVNGWFMINVQNATSQKLKTKGHIANELRRQKQSKTGPTKTKRVSTTTNTWSSSPKSLFVHRIISSDYSHIQSTVLQRYQLLKWHITQNKSSKTTSASWSWMVLNALDWLAVYMETGKGINDREIN